MKRILNSIFNRATRTKPSTTDRFYEHKIDRIWDQFHQAEEPIEDPTFSSNGFGNFLAINQFGALITHADYRAQ